MLKIGEFADLSGLSIKTLRYYDRLGLLTPDRVDPANGYRYYAEERLLTAKRIAALKREGLTLEQIGRVLRDGASAEDAREARTARADELRRTIAEARSQLAELERGFDGLARAERHAHGGAVRVRPVSPLLAASLREKAPLSKLCLLIDEVERHVRAAGSNADTVVLLWHGRDTCDRDDTVDVEVAVPMPAPVTETGRIRNVILPAIAEAASVTLPRNPYRPSYPDEALTDWLRAAGREAAAGEPLREVYLTADRDIVGLLRPAELLVPLAPSP